MKNFFTITLLLISGILSAETLKTLEIFTKAKHNRKLKFSYRLPKDGKPKRIMVLFGGRNWPGDKTIRTFNFNILADQHGIILLSPWFKDDEYWQPEKWSGKALIEAVSLVRKQYSVPADSKLFYYGYSAGAQCVAQFYAWKPELISAWGLHACGVWFKPEELSKHVPALVTCGENDTGRYELSWSSVQRWRDNGASVIWRAYKTGHELNNEALQLARSFFEAQLQHSPKIKYIGDDQTRQYYTDSVANRRKIEDDYRSTFYSLQTVKLWAEGLN